LVFYFICFFCKYYLDLLPKNDDDDEDEENHEGEGEEEHDEGCIDMSK